MLTVSTALASLIVPHTLPLALGQPDALAEVLKLFNVMLSSVNFVVIFSLLIYVLFHSWRNVVARSFSLLIATLMPVYIAIIILLILPASSLSEASFWLHVQWLGIAFVPAAYLHFSNVLLETTNAFSLRRRVGVRLVWLASLTFFLIASFSSLVIEQPTGGAPTRCLINNGACYNSGPVFIIFFFYAIIVMVWGISSILRARNRALTSSSRRRLSYLTIASTAPGVAIFPYLTTVALAPSNFLPRTLLFLTLVGNLGLVVLSVMMAYSVAFNGVLLPERTVKHSLIYYLLRGPAVVIIVIVLVLLTPRVEIILGIPYTTVLIFSVTFSVLVWQAMISVAHGWIDRLLYQGDDADIRLLRELDKSLLTEADLRSLFENTLASLADLLRADRGFVASLLNARGEYEPTISATVGWEGGAQSRAQVEAQDRLSVGGSHALGALSNIPAQVRWAAPRLLGRSGLSQPTVELLQPLLEPFSPTARVSLPTLDQAGQQINVNINVNVSLRPPLDERYIPIDGVVGLLENGYLLLPLRDKLREQVLGLIGLRVAGAGLSMTEAGRRLGLGLGLSYEEEERVGLYVRQAEVALEDSLLQRRLFATLRQISPEIAEVQRWRSTLQERQQTAPLRQPNIASIVDDSAIVDDPDFARTVKDALGHYWGGPRLSESPLLKLKAVHALLPSSDEVPSKALRALLSGAIDALRPPEPASSSERNSPAWTVYNILDLRYRKGASVREVAGKLAMSEPDFYRKQKAAIAELAKSIAHLEREALLK